MPEHPQPHEGLAEYLLDDLAGSERAGFEAHLEGCAACRDEVRELHAVSALLARAVPGYDVPPGLEARTFAALERAAAPPPVEERAWRRWLGVRRVALVAAAAAVLVVGVLAATRLGGPSAVELEAVLAPPGGGAERAAVSVTKTGIGRVVELRTDDLPILPKGDYYELWFVGAGDSRERPNRISAGTFHPDPEGRSNATFTAAVDPARFPVLSITAEPGDGDPRPTGPEVLRSRR